MRPTTLLRFAACPLIGLVGGYLYHLSRPASFESIAIVAVDPGLSRPSGRQDAVVAVSDSVTEFFQSHFLAEEAVKHAAEAASNKNSDFRRARVPSDQVTVWQFGLQVRLLDSSAGTVEIRYAAESPRASREAVEALIAAAKKVFGTERDEPGERDPTKNPGVEKDELLAAVDQKEAALQEFRMAAPPEWPGCKEYERRRAELITWERRYAQLELAVGPQRAPPASPSGSNAGTVGEAKRGANANSPTPASLRPADRASGVALIELLMEEASLLQRYGVNHPKLKAVRARINAFQVESGVETPLSRLRAEEVLLLETFGPEHPKVKEVRKRIAALDEPDPKKADLSSTDAPDVGAKVTIPVDLAAQRQELERLKERIDRRREEVRDLSEWNSLELSLVQDVETARRLSQTVPAPRPDVAVVRPPRGEYVKVLSEPQAGVPKSRSPWKALCLGSGAGALVGVVLIGASRDRISVANRAKPENLPVIRLPTPDVTLLHGGDGDAISPCFIVQHQPQSYEANTYRSLRTALRFGAGKGAGRSFAVLCTSPGDESRIIAVNLAASFALAGRRTLFIDALATGHSAVRLFADQVQVLETTDPGATICNRTANTRLPRLAVAEANPSLEAASIDDLARSAASLLQHYEVTIFFTNSPRKIAKLTPAGLHECTIVVAPYAQSVEKPADVLSSDAESLEESVIAIATFGSTLE